MPNYFQNAFAIDSKIVRVREIENGIFQARYRRDGYNIEVASKNYEILKRKFLEKLELGPTNGQKSSKYPKFSDYGEGWLKIKKMTTKESTYKEYERVFRADLSKKFGNFRVNEITRQMIQDYLFEFIAQEKYRTADKLKLQLNCIFDMVSEDFGINSPMKKVVIPHHEKKAGVPLNFEEEKQLVEYCLNNLDKEESHAYLTLLYFGLRKSELKSLQVIDIKWLQCETSKEKLGKNIVLRKIPFTETALKVIPHIDFEKAKNVELTALLRNFKKIFPNHHPHELRHTFVSRCKECGVQSEVVSIWAGHSLSGTITSTVYTHYSDEFMQKQAKIVNYTY